MATTFTMNYMDSIFEEVLLTDRELHSVADHYASINCKPYYPPYQEDSELQGRITFFDLKVIPV